MAESSLNFTMTGIGQNQLQTEAKRCKNLLLAQKKLLVEKITRCKEIIRQLHLSEDSGLSITDLALEIGSKIRADLGATFLRNFSTNNFFSANNKCLHLIASVRN